MDGGGASGCRPLDYESTALCGGSTALQSRRYRGHCGLWFARLTATTDICYYRHSPVHEAQGPNQVEGRAPPLLPNQIATAPNPVGPILARPLSNQLVLLRRPPTLFSSLPPSLSLALTSLAPSRSHLPLSLSPAPPFSLSPFLPLSLLHLSVGE